MIPQWVLLRHKTWPLAEGTTEYVAWVASKKGPMKAHELTTEILGYECQFCDGHGEFAEEWVNRGCAPGEERFSNGACPPCGGNGWLEDYESAVDSEDWEPDYPEGGK